MPNTSVKLADAKIYFLSASKDKGNLEAADRSCPGKIITFEEVKTKVNYTTTWIPEKNLLLVLEYNSHHVFVGKDMQVKNRYRVY